MFGVILNDDKLDVLEDIAVTGESKPVKWEIDATKTQLWGKLTEDEITRMASAADEVAFHWHKFSISTNKFNSIQKLKDFMIIT